MIAIAFQGVRWSEDASLRMCYIDVKSFRDESSRHLFGELFMRIAIATSVAALTLFFSALAGAADNAPPHNAVPSVSNG